MEFVSYDIQSNDFRQAGGASRAIKDHLKRIGADAEAIRRTMIAAYEAEMNVVIHSVGGRLEASFSDSRIDVNVVDEGPGIPDVELAMTEGYSTASADARAMGFGAGLGLPNIKRSSDRLRVTSRVGEGTRVSFTVNLRPGITSAAPAISLYVSPDRCCDCRACLSACPTQALRVREGRPSVLEHLCIDCAQCIAACKTGALTVRDVLPSVDDLACRPDTTLLVPPALLAGCGPDHPPADALTALERMGFAGVDTITPFEEALRDAAGPEAVGPVIVPVCPAVVNLVELKFPSLVGLLAPFETPWEAVRTSRDEHPLACVVSCPGQRSVLARMEETPVSPGGDSTTIECLLPEAVGRPLMQELSGVEMPGPVGQASAAATRESGFSAQSAPPHPGPSENRQTPTEDDGLLVVSGMHHVMAVLEELENGLLDDVPALEAYACEGGCFGSPLLFEDHHVSRRRWNRGKAAVETVAAASGTRWGFGARPTTSDLAIPQQRPHAARPGIRLDPDMGRAIQKLGRLQAITRSLPGRDCGACGAPTCAALAEDTVMGRAAIELCPYIDYEKGGAEP